MSVRDIQKEIAKHVVVNVRDVPGLGTVHGTTIGGHESHPLADALPLMTDSELISMIDSMECYGVLHKPKRFEGKTLDGRNRVLAMTILGLPIEFEEFTGTIADAFAYMDVEFERRKLALSQRVVARKRLDVLRRKLVKTARSKQRRFTYADKEKLERINSTATDELKQAMLDETIDEEGAEQVTKLSADEQRAEVARLQSHANSEPQRASTKPKSVFIVHEPASGDVASVWTHKERAVQVAQELRDDLGMNYVVGEFELNAIDGAVV